VDAQELAQREKQWQPPAPKITTGYAYRYSQLVTSASTGAVFKK
jgi:dihydroxy-acid dehydratase